MSTSDPGTPKRPRRRRKPSPDSESPRPKDETQQQDETTRGDSEADEATLAPSEPEAPIAPTPEADETAEPVAQEDEPSEKPARRRRRAKAEPEAPEEETVEEPEAVEESEPAGEPEAPVAPARRRRRQAERDPNLPPPIVRAQAKYVRSSARKARLVCDHIRGKSVEEARAILAHAPRAVARDWSKLLESAVANAEHNHELVGEDLYVKTVQADEGPTIKRYRPRALGRATRIRKRTSHLTILLTPKD